MGISIEKVSLINKVNAADLNRMGKFMLTSISLSPTDDMKTIEKKTNIIEVYIQFLINSIDIDALPTAEEQTDYIKLLSKLTQQKEELEILTGKLDIKELERAARSFAQKTQLPIGIDA